MKRKHTILEYKSIVRKVRQIRPDISLTSDFIVGYPGETDIDFQKTMDFISEINFSDAYSFIYSPRPGTPASKLKDDTPIAEKKERLAVLQNQLDTHHKEHSNKMIGSIQRCLVTGLAKKSPDQLQARTECNRVVNFDFQNIGFTSFL